MSFKIFSKRMKNLIILDNHKIKNLIKLIFYITIFYFFILFVNEKIKISTFLYLSYLFFVNYFLFYLYLSSKKEKNYFPIYPLIIFYYLLTYSCYFYFYQKMYYVDFSGAHGFGVMKHSETLELLPYLILIISLGIISFSVGYFAPNYLKYKKKVYAFRTATVYEYLLIFFFIIILIFYYINHPNRFVTLNFLGQLKEPLIFFLLAYFQIKYLNTKKNLFLILNIFLLLFFFTIELSFGSTAFPYLLIAFVISINYYKSKKINIITIALFFISFFAIHGLKDELRKEIWERSVKDELRKDELKKETLESKTEDELSSENSLKYYDVVTNTYKKKVTSIDNDSIISNRNLIIENVTDTFKVINTNVLSLEGLNNMSQKENVSVQKKRFFHSGISLQLVIDQTPQNVDFFNGKSYAHIHKKILPRFINKNKPREEWGNFWGQRYGVLTRDNITSWNFPILNEFFANYGLKGVIIGMFLFGMFIKTLMIAVPLNSSNVVIFSGVCTIIFNFFFHELNLSFILGKMINYSTIFGLIFISILITSYFFEKIVNIKT